MKALYVLLFFILTINPVMGGDIKSNIQNQIVFEKINILTENNHGYLASNLSLRSPTCSSQQMLDILKYLKILNVKNNQDLAISVANLYGDSVWQEMVKMHPYLSIKEGILDVETAEWLMDSLLKIDPLHFKEIIVMFENLSSGDFLAAFSSLLSSSIKGKISNRIIFMTKERRDEFRAWFRNEFTKEELAELYADDLVQLLPTIPYETLISWGERFYHGVLSSDRYVAFNVNRAPGVTSTIDLWGHGKVGVHGIVNDERNEKIMVPQIIQRLKEKGLIDNHTGVRLTACHGACGVSVQNLPFTSREIKKMFQLGTLREYLMKDSGNSLIHAVRKELSRQVPGHAAAVEGYLGENNTVLFEDTFHMDGTTKLSHAISVYDSNGKEILLNRFQMIVTLNP